VTCIVSGILYFAISDFPEEATWLTTEEKAFVEERLYDDFGDSNHDVKVDSKGVLQALKDCKLNA
jgi:hypothetical protein